LQTSFSRNSKVTPHPYYDYYDYAGAPLDRC
jgi:hypothetical protein